MKNKIKKDLGLFICLLLAAAGGSGAYGQGAAWKFDFGPGKTADGYTKVLPSTLYTPELGYGFDFGSAVTGGSAGGRDALHDGFCSSGRPFYFSVKVPEGNYSVTLVLGDQAAATVTTVKAECRRLMVEKQVTRPGEFATVHFTVHVRDSIIRNADGSRIPVRLKQREYVYLHWDDKLTLEFSNTSPKICAVEIRPVKNLVQVFLAGNSTVVDQADEPWAAWGQMIPAFFKPDGIVIANYAESGETLKAFVGERRLAKVWTMAHPGDYLFIEFAHNDQKPGGNYLEPFTTYKEKLKWYITEARQRGVIPVLVTSMNRRSFDSAGHIINTLGDYPEAMRQTAKEMNTGLVDLNTMSKLLYEAWGPDQSVHAFVDNTHFNNYGAYELARCMVNGIRQGVPGLSKYLKDDIAPFDPAHPDPLESWSLPMSGKVAVAKPDGN
jgi:lysophospholipase L1-like esterase